MNSSRPIKLVAIDLDGTLLNSAKAVCPAAGEALVSLPGRGIKVIIASARPPRGVRAFYECLRLDTWQINYNGALIWDEPARRVIEHVPLAGEKVLALIRQARALFPRVLVSCEILDRWFTDSFDNSHTTETGKLFAPDVVAPVEEFCRQPVTKLMLLGEPQMMTALQGLFSADTEINAVRSDPDLIQIMAARVSKAAALKKVADHYRIAMNEVMAIGDAANDIPMLESAAVGVAMSNAPAAVQAVADWVAPSNDDRGVHAALVRYGLLA